MQLTLTSWTLLLCIFAWINLSVTSADASEWKHHEIDRRNASSEVEYSLMFMVRVSDSVLQWPGHAYMMAGEVDHRQKVCRLDADKAFGYHPVEEANTAAVLLRFSVPGEIRTTLEDDITKGLATHCLTIRTAQNGFDAARQSAKSFAEENDYRFGETDCVAFMHAMLLAVKQATRGAEDQLVVPGKKDLQKPKDFLRALLVSNGLPVDDD